MLKLEEEILKMIDKAITINHKIVSYFIEMIEKENNGTNIDEKRILNNPILKRLFEQEQECYRRIYDEIVKYKTYDIEDAGILDIFGDVDNIINILEDYITEAYESLKYIDGIRVEYDEQGNIIHQEQTPSIYENDKHKSFRICEVSTTLENLENMERRSEFDLDLNDLTTLEKGNIIYDMSEKKFYKDYAIKQINRYISDLEAKMQEMDSKDYSYTKQQLVERKYMYYYSYLNNMYNGILQENEIPGFRTIKRFIDDGLEALFLEMNEEEIKRSIDINVSDNKNSFKREMKKIIKPQKTQNQKMQKDKNEEKIEEEAEK